jgi:hypothetical protein
MPNLTKLPTWADKAHIHAVVETPRGSRCKLEFDPKHRAFTLAKPLLAGLTYPYDWGFIPSTEAEDGDPLDVLVIHEAATIQACFSAANRSECSKFFRPLRAKRKGTTEFSRYPTALLLRAIFRTYAVFQRGRLRNWRNFSKQPMRSRTKSSNFWDGAARRLRSRQ